MKNTFKTLAILFLLVYSSCKAQQMVQTPNDAHKLKINEQQFLNKPLKYFAHDLRRFFVDNKAVPVGRVFFVAVAGERTDKLALFTFCIKGAPDFPAYVARILLIDNIFKGNYDAVHTVFLIKRIYTVIHRYKT